MDVLVSSTTLPCAWKNIAISDVTVKTFVCTGAPIHISWKIRTGLTRGDLSPMIEETQYSGPPFRPMVVNDGQFTSHQHIAFFSDHVLSSMY